MKQALRQLLERRDLAEIRAQALRRRRVLNMLVSITYDPDPLIVWRAIEALGEAAGGVAREDPEVVRNHLRRLLWLISEESGAQCWRAPEAMAEIVHNDPRQFADQVPIIVNLLREMAEEDLEFFRPGILWAIGRLGPAARESLEEVLPAVVAALEDASPLTRGMAVWCLGEVGRDELLTAENLAQDDGPLSLYEDGELVETTVGELVGRYVSTAG
jgi:HEAT repeat protein